jgi:hypothetical protein
LIKGNLVIVKESIRLLEATKLFKVRGHCGNELQNIHFVKTHLPNVPNKYLDKVKNKSVFQGRFIKDVQLFWGSCKKLKNILS